VSVDSNFACGVRTDGTIACWGQNTNGQATPPAP
jgi:alpha-tubulin suppressor-like RCC1 family protein